MDNKICIYLCVFFGIAIIACNGSALAMNGKPKKPDNAEQTDNINPYFNEMMKHHDEIIKNTDAMFKKQREYIQKMISHSMNSSGYSSMNSSLEMDEPNCKYTVNLVKYNKENMQIHLDDGILTISGNKQQKVNDSQSSGHFYYSFSIPNTCIGSPRVEYKPESVKIFFKQND